MMRHFGINKTATTNVQKVTTTTDFIAQFAAIHDWMSHSPKNTGSNMLSHAACILSSLSPFTTGSYRKRLRGAQTKKVREIYVGCASALVQLLRPIHRAGWTAFKYSRDFMQIWCTLVHEQHPPSGLAVTSPSGLAVTSPKILSDTSVFLSETQ